ncbi:MAG: ABC transporter permease [Planctomycetota bacterium]|jgi:peptide/nickel transport system permease protein|nr:ABC transporter permease [Planctomycetota bacterium]
MSSTPTSTPQPDTRDLEYWQIVWGQLRRNRQAMVALVFILVLFVLAIFAPVLAHDAPFVYDGENGTEFPWFRQLFLFEFQHDHFFNCLMLLLLPGLAVLWGGWRLSAGNADWPRGRVVVWWGVGFLGVVTTLALLTRIGPLTPQSELERSFVLEKGVFPPIPYSFRTRDADFVSEGPGVEVTTIDQEGNEIILVNPHWLGTDAGGRDVAARLLYGARVALTIGFIGVAIYVAIGVLIGACAGYFGGWVDILISRLVEIMITFPSFFLILVLVGVLREHEDLRNVPKIFVIMFVIGFTSWTGVARLIRGEFLKFRGREFVLAARALGLSNARIILRHILPNAIAPALVSATFGVAGAILTESGLSFLGVGIDAPAASWGQMVKVGYENYEWWWILWPSTAMIFLTVTAYNILGEGLRDALDPHLRE